MKTLIIYYSLEGNTRQMAEWIQKETGGELLELKPKKDIPSKGFMRYVKGGKQVLLKQKPDLYSIHQNIDEYDYIYMGTPVWAGSFVPAFLTLFSMVHIKNKKIALFCTNKRSCGNTFDHFKKALEGNHIVGELDCKDPVENETNKKNVLQWVKSMDWGN
ncbi:flavodoxin family protein [Inediibacterium massiliense]|uniref:flavodoxin family protein n=1 Tax=Inediibacterium massiliense TaxID=1658111 RepID=UPI0006B494EE|nr:NAD(P)H-dependent oxidoreductase [Inediibacterium massiliense]